jgi:hypothetical protein
VCHPTTYARGYPFKKFSPPLWGGGGWKGKFLDDSERQVLRRYAEKAILRFAWKDWGKLRCLRMANPKAASTDRSTLEGAARNIHCH